MPALLSAWFHAALLPATAAASVDAGRHQSTAEGLVLFYVQQSSSCCRSFHTRFCWTGLRPHMRCIAQEAWTRAIAEERNSTNKTINVAVEAESVTVADRFCGLVNQQGLFGGDFKEE